MYKVKILCNETDDYDIINAIMPQIPQKGDYVGYWIDVGKEKEWVIAQVIQLVYEFDRTNKFECVEITVDY